MTVITTNINEHFLIIDSDLILLLYFVLFDFLDCMQEEYWRAWYTKRSSDFTISLELHNQKLPLKDTHMK